MMFTKWKFIIVGIFLMNNKKDIPTFLKQQ